MAALCEALGHGLLCLCLNPPLYINIYKLQFFHIYKETTTDGTLSTALQEVMNELPVDYYVCSHLEASNNSNVTTFNNHKRVG
jgi:hypothetical protein